METVIERSLDILVSYLEIALEKSYFPDHPPIWALDSVWEVFEISMRERTKIPGSETMGCSDNPYVRALRYVYPRLLGVGTPNSFLAIVRFLNTLRKKHGPVAMDEIDKELGQETLGILRMFRNQGPEEVIASVVFAKLGIPLTQ